MKKKKTLIVLGVIVALTIGATALWAITYYEGEGLGMCILHGDTVYPWAEWDGDLDGSTFSGDWTDGTTDGGFSGTTVEKGYTDSVYGTWWVDGMDPNPVGNFKGVINPDTCTGEWDDAYSTEGCECEDGTWDGHSL